MDVKKLIPNLLAFAGFMSPEVKAELEFLIGEAEKGADEETIKLMDTQKKTLEEIFKITGRALNQAHAPVAEPTKVVTTPKAGKPAWRKYTKRVGKKTKSAKKLATELPRSQVAEEMIADDFPLEVAEMIGLMETEANYPDNAKEARAFTARRLGLNPETKNGLHQMAGRISRTRGLFFPKWVKKVCAEFDQTKQVDFATIVAPVVSKLFKKNISANDLLNMMS